MKLWISLWIREPPQHKDNFSECLVRWLSMARIFGRHDLFEKVTREIILERRYYGRITRVFVLWCIALTKLAIW